MKAIVDRSCRALADLLRRLARDLDGRDVEGFLRRERELSARRLVQLRERGQLIERMKESLHRKKTELGRVNQLLAKAKGEDTRCTKVKLRDAFDANVWANINVKNHGGDVEQWGLYECKICPPNGMTGKIWHVTSTGDGSSITPIPLSWAEIKRAKAPRELWDIPIA